MTTLERLATTIASRKTADPDSSWTAKLLSHGPEKCAEKFGEEAVEAIIEAVKGDRARLTCEAADVLYHLLVMLAARDVTLDEVLAELARRGGRLPDAADARGPNPYQTHFITDYRRQTVSKAATLWPNALAQCSGRTKALIRSKTGDRRAPILPDKNYWYLQIRWIPSSFR
jgi:phosphoribosyl-ATP pyrophosphohydrolase